MGSVWDKLNIVFAPCLHGEEAELIDIETKAHKVLSDCGIIPISFSHFGVVVKNIETSLSKLNDLLVEKIGKPHKVWVDSYKVFVARFSLEGKELEFIEPVGDSFFSTFMEEKGEGLQHISFRVDDAYVSFEKLKNNQIELIDHQVRNGSHGRIAFVKPAILDYLYLEICEYE